MTQVSLLQGDVRSVLAALPDASVRCCITSPPYWGLRDYGEEGQIGLESTPEEYIARLVEVFREVRRVLTDDGTLWLNLGDSYATSGGAGYQGKNGQRADRTFTQESLRGRGNNHGCKPKDLVGIPWMAAFALRADGWYLRSDIIWHKPNPMPESVLDRPTKAHEYLFLLSKSDRYFYDVDAIREPHIWADDKRNDGKRHTYSDDAKHNQKDPDRQRAKTDCVSFHPNGRNSRTVWTIATQPYSGAHFATFPEELPRRCIKAGSAPGDTVLDPFGGSGTTAAVAVGLGRSAVHIDLNPEYIELARQRIGPMFCSEGLPCAPEPRSSEADSALPAGGE